MLRDFWHDVHRKRNVHRRNNRDLYGANTNRDRDGYLNWDSYRDGDGNLNGDGYRNGDRHRDRHANTHGNTDPRAERRRVHYASRMRVRLLP